MIKIVRFSQNSKYYINHYNYNVYKREYYNKINRV